MPKLIAYVVLAALALAGSLFSCAHGGVSSPGHASLTIIPATLIA
jgi:hypothetical protein